MVLHITKGFNCRSFLECDFPEQIDLGRKTIETRFVTKGTDNKGSLDSLIGKTVACIHTGKGRPYIGSVVKIVGKKIYNTSHEFYDDENYHMCGPYSRFSWNGKKRIGYILDLVYTLQEPEYITSKGNVIRNIDYTIQFETPSTNVNFF